MYQEIIGKIVELGNTLPEASGRVWGREENKEVLSRKDEEIETELSELIKTFPGRHSVYAEELHNDFVEDENVWIIDPISNTANFIHGLPHYSVALSHLHKGETQFSAVYDPSNKELFIAEKRKGSFLNGKKIRVSNRAEKILFLIGPNFIPSEPYGKKALRVAEEMSAPGNIARIFGSLGIHYAYVACGRADAAVSFNVDTFPEFAGELLIEEAGGRFTDFQGNPLRVATRGVIASNGLVHEQIKNIMEKIV